MNRFGFIWVSLLAGLRWVWRSDVLRNESALVFGPSFVGWTMTQSTPVQFLWTTSTLTPTHGTRLPCLGTGEVRPGAWFHDDGELHATELSKTILKRKLRDRKEEKAALATVQHEWRWMGCVGGFWSTVLLPFGAGSADTATTTSRLRPALSGCLRQFP